MIYSKDSRYAFNLTELIFGLEKPVLYKLDTRERFTIDQDSASVLAQFQTRTFLLRELKDCLLRLYKPADLSGPEPRSKMDVDTFISFMLNNNLITPNKLARKSDEEIHRLEQQSLNDRRLEILGIELTDFCNFSCPHCSPDSGKKLTNSFLHTDTIIEILKWIVSMNLREVVLTGGEPFMHPGISIILKALTYSEFQTVITTNGSVLRDQHIHSIERSNVNVRVSMYGGQRYYEAFGPGRQTYKRVIQTILKLKSAIDGRVSCVIPVMGSNLESYEDRVRFCEENEIPYQVNIICPFGRALRNWNSEALDKSVEKRIRNQYHQYALKKNRGYRVLYEKNGLRLHIFPCNLNQLNVLSDQSITPCLSIRTSSLGKYNKNAGPEQLSALFYSDAYIDFQKSFAVNRRKICNDCEFKYDCGGGCPAKAKSYFGTLNAPDPQCENHDVISISTRMNLHKTEFDSIIQRLKGGDVCGAQNPACYQTRHTQGSN